MAFELPCSPYRPSLSDVQLERSILANVGAELIIAGQADDPIALAADADAILTTYFPIGAEELKRLDRCRIIARYGIGVDNIDLAAARARGIVVTNVPDYSVEEVAVHTLLLLLGRLRRLPTAIGRAKRGEKRGVGCKGLAKLGGGSRSPIPRSKPFWD